LFSLYQSRLKIGLAFHNLINMSDNEEIEGEGEAAVEEPIVEEEEEDER